MVGVDGFFFDFGTEPQHILQAGNGGEGVQLVPVTHHSRDLGVGVGARCVVK